MNEKFDIQSPNIQNPAPKKLNIWLIITIIVVILAIIGGLVVYFWSKDIKEQIKNIQSKILPVSYSKSCSWRPDKTDYGSCNENLGAYFDGEDCVNISGCASRLAVPFESLEKCQQKCEQISGEPRHYLIEVDWEKNLILQEKTDYIDNYLAGKITNGSLAGRNLYLEVEHSMGDIFRHYILLDDNKFYLDGYYRDEEVKNWEIKGISDLPEEIKFPNTNYKLRKRDYINYLFSNIKSIKREIFSHETLGPFYLTGYMTEDCLITELPDHTVIAYDFQLPFITNEDRELEVTFNSGIKNTDEYSFTAFVGCVSICVPLDAIANLSDSDFVMAGKAKTGEEFYEFKDSQNKMLMDLYNDKNTKAYYDTNGVFKKLEQSKYTYEEFIALHPLLFWKDPLGRWIRFKNEKLGTMAEICKPAIYLYPEQKLGLNVKIDPNGGFTKTIPQYDSGGWNVEAYPNGTISDLDTGNEYSYLYWSGIGVDYPINDKEGWVVKKESIEPFLDEKLSILGLNENEISDFKDYWIERLSEMPYYHISFLSQDQIDKIAPLAISPVEPNNVIRVIMTAEGLTEYKIVEEQELPVASDRSGFTVVEWGGVLLR